MKKMKAILFDSHAILRWSQEENGYEEVKSLIFSCREGTVSGYMCYINLGEVYYKSIRNAGPERAKIFLENFFRLPIQLVLPDENLIWKASKIKAEIPISYADCFAAATALRYEATILTGDPEFKKLEHMITVRWV
jgi:ribonuclease VapC